MVTLGLSKERLVRQDLSNVKKSSQGFTREQQVDQFGLLFAADGVILTRQSNMISAEEVKLLSDFGAVVTAKMKTVFGTSQSA